jgi:hypothetical protein
VVDDSHISPTQPINRAEGIIPEEQYLKRLRDHSLLSLWSYPSVYRNQKAGHRGDGKEVCDLLVVFGDDLVIFSDKAPFRIPATSIAIGADGFEAQ